MNLFIFQNPYEFFQFFRVYENPFMKKIKALTVQLSVKEDVSLYSQPKVRCRVYFDNNTRMKKNI